MPYKYSTKTGTWTYVKTNPSAKKGGGNVIPPPKLEEVPNMDGAGKGTKGKDDRTTKTKQKSNKRFLEIEYQILKGELQVIPDLNYKARTTIVVDGLGKYLSGMYYVENVSTHFGKDCLTQTLSVIKNGFGDTMKIRENAPRIVITDEDGRVINTISSPNKSITTVVNGKTSVSTIGKSNIPKKQVPVKPNPQRTHILRKGESLWLLAQRYYRDGNKWRVIAKANNISDRDVTRLSIGRKLIIP